MLAEEVHRVLPRAEDGSRGDVGVHDRVVAYSHSLPLPLRISGTFRRSSSSSATK